MNSQTTTTNDSASAATTDASSRHTDFSQLTVEESLATLGASRKGLDQDEVAKRLIAFGPNEIQEKKRQPLLFLFLKQFKSLLIAVLFMAATLSYITGNIAD
ncbi:MAG: cation-transporting P-type ATPase, partial [Imperialibacter sp.]